MGQVNSGMFELRNMTKRYGSMVAVDRVSLRFSSGTITAVIGPNGSGKTTLLHAATGVLPADEGEILLDGKDLTGYPCHRRIRAGMARTFQLVRIIPQMNVLENMLLALENNLEERLLRAINPFRSYSSRLLEDRALGLLSRVGLAEMRDTLAGELSYGQKRLLELARTVALPARVFLFDEPTAGVFPEVRLRILEIFRELRDKGKIIIFIEHDMEAVTQAAERVITLHRGKVIADGTPDAVLNSPQVRESYFGQTGEESC